MIRNAFLSLRKLGIDLQTIKTALACGLSWVLAEAVMPHSYPYFAPIAAILTLQVTVADSIQKGLYRIVGIVVGIGISLLAGQWLSVNAWTVALVVLAGLAIANGMRLNAQIGAQIGVSALLVLAFGNANGYAAYRILETLLGSAVAVAVNIALVPRDTTREALYAASGLGKRIAAVLRDYDEAVRGNRRLAQVLEEARGLLLLIQRGNEATALARQSLKFVPLGRKRRERVARVSAAMERLEHLSVQARGIARSLIELDEAAMRAPGLVPALLATAECVDRFADTVTDPSPQAYDRLREATEGARGVQLESFGRSMAGADPDRLKLIGSVYADLGRMLTEVVRTEESGNA
ncbi:FUSC family protein [Cohnella rhizosphaerae]|uniref:Aromatic acid exporter family protein n=1 Tax=Cohnella rhizosphaerae TaxID=1457232 RepID=A0A9X4L3W5_9BACL|nr:aromatic acid exporter family protein [Cohnella rhizosphaerae]MDG0813279.1 aromatic acid exporter family protein [Cohnella rhizosphaerae]